MWIEILFVFFVLLIGSFIQGVSGFGFGLVAMGLLPFLFTVKDSTLLVISLAIVLAGSILIKEYKHLDIKGLSVILSAAIVGRIGAFFFLTNFGELEELENVLGLFLMGMVLYLFFKKKGEGPSRLMLHPLTPVLLGLVGGFVGGVFAVGGPFFVVYFLMLYQNKHRYNANMQASFFITSLLTLVLHGTSGDLNPDFFVYFLIGIASVILGSRVGLLFFDRLSQRRVQQSAMALVFLAGLSLILFS
ncbi:sulfite exporter TauE/SafE family protein [Salsuginibacillus kocurii]|uniref:sulfite exporter TauE/SafE family protein n=1 Tax=Salsuginibacillus kocurii TaxID=427078 RepID=UPI00037FCF43|nr:sulfite exporter TauE/SafE family protein [Salsuginibacillus kocurii]